MKTHEIDTGIDVISFQYVDTDVGTIDLPYTFRPILALKRTAQEGSTLSKDKSKPRHVQWLGQRARCNAEHARWILRRALRSKVPKPIYRMLVDMAYTSFQAGFFYERMRVAEAERRATVGKKIFDKSKEPRKPSIETVPGALLQIPDWRIQSTNALVRQINKMGGRFARMKPDNIKRQILKARNRRKESRL